MITKDIENFIEKEIKTENFSWVFSTLLYGNGAAVNKNEIIVFNEDMNKYITLNLPKDNK